jgi:hypothetical protein
MWEKTPEHLTERERLMTRTEAKAKAVVYLCTTQWETGTERRARCERLAARSGLQVVEVIHDRSGVQEPQHRAGWCRAVELLRAQGAHTVIIPGRDALSPLSAECTRVRAEVEAAGAAVVIAGSLEQPC